MIKNIPAEDVKLINDSFKKTDNAETLGKDAFGRLIVAQKKIVNSKGFVINGFMGRTLRHQKSLVPIDGKQITIGVKGQRYDDLDPKLRTQVDWFESDFE